MTEKVRERVLKLAGALEGAEVPYALVGEAAVAWWVSRTDAEAAVLKVRQVDVLLRREDLDGARAALEAVGFIYRRLSGRDQFLDGPKAKARDAVHIVFANEKTRLAAALPAPDVTPSVHTGEYRVLTLDALVRMGLADFRDEDQMNCLDLIEVGAVDPTWPARYPLELGTRLQSLLDELEG